MKRISEKELKGEMILPTITSAVFILFGIFMPICTWFSPTMPYEELQEKTVVVDEFRRIKWIDFSKYGSSHTTYRINTKDGESFNITGDFNYTELKEALTSGTVAQIKWYENPLNFTAECCEELTVGGKTLVGYNEDEPRPVVIPIIFSVLSILAGLLVFFWGRWYTNHLRTLQEKRDRRIEKKYGSVNKKEKKK